MPVFGGRFLPMQKSYLKRHLLLGLKAPEKYSHDIKTYKIYLADSLKKSGQHVKAAEKLKRFIESENANSPLTIFWPFLYSRLAENLRLLKKKLPKQNYFYLNSIDFLKNQNDFLQVKRRTPKTSSFYTEKSFNS